MLSWETQQKINRGLGKEDKRELEGMSDESENGYFGVTVTRTIMVVNWDVSTSKGKIEGPSMGKDQKEDEVTRKEELKRFKEKSTKKEKRDSRI